MNVKVHEPEERGCCCCTCCCSEIPGRIAEGLSGTLCDNDEAERFLTVSLGIFSIVRIVRPAQYLIHATEYCVPDKECIAAEEDDPCSIFRSMAFPSAEFCSTGLDEHHHDHNGKCGCS